MMVEAENGEDLGREEAEVTREEEEEKEEAERVQVVEDEADGKSCRITAWAMSLFNNSLVAKIDRKLNRFLVFFNRFHYLL